MKERIANQHNLHAALKKDWLNRTFQLCSELNVVADVLMVRSESFVFRLGKLHPLSVLRTPRNSTVIKYFADVGDRIEEKEMSGVSPKWNVLIPEVIQTLQKHRNQLFF